MRNFQGHLGTHDHIDAQGNQAVRDECVICSANKARNTSSKPMTKPATEPQIKFILDLKRQEAEARQTLGLGPSNPAADIDRMWFEREAVTTVQGSAMIDALKVIVNDLKIQVRIQQAAKPKATTPELEAGYYVLDQEVFKVQRAVHGNGRMYCKKLTVDAETGRGRFEYDPANTRRVMSMLTPAHELNRETAKILGPVYGVCVRCGAPLTEDDSISRMMGPVCWKKTGA